MTKKNSQTPASLRFHLAMPMLGLPANKSLAFLRTTRLRTLRLAGKYFRNPGLPNDSMKLHAGCLWENTFNKHNVIGQACPN